MERDVSFHWLESYREPVLHFLLISDGSDKERKGVERRGGRNRKEWNNLFPRAITSFMCVLEVWGVVDYRILDMNIYCVVLVVGYFTVFIIFIDVWNTYCIWYSHLLIPQIFIEWFTKEDDLIQFPLQAPCGESRIIVVLSPQMIRLHFREVK